MKTNWDRDYQAHIYAGDQSYQTEITKDSDYRLPSGPPFPNI